MPPPHAPAPPLPHRDAPPPPLFAGPGLLPIHPAALLEEAGRDGPPFGLHGGRPPPHPAVIEEHLAVQHQEVQGLLADNQRLAATHVALKQDVDAAQHEIRRMSHAFASMQADKDLQIREVYEKSIKLELELRAVVAMKGELIQTRGDIQKLTAVKQELTGQVQALTQEVTRASADLQQVPAVKAEIEATKQEIQRVDHPTTLSAGSSNLKYRNPKYLSMLNHLRFYLPEVYPKLDKILFLDDDIVVQKDLTALWSVDLKGNVNGAVETCGESFHRFDKYLNFSNPHLARNFDPNACGWAYGMNVFDLKEWKKKDITGIYHKWQNLLSKRCR